MYSVFGLIVHEILGYFKDEAKVRDAVRNEARRRGGRQQVRVEENKELNDAITAFMKRNTSAENTAEATDPPKGAVEPGNPSGPAAETPPGRGAASG
jgi:hypothetical protein